MPNLSVPKIRLLEGQLVTDSRDVADFFQKRHVNVIRRIESLECSEEFSRLNIEPAKYVDRQGKVRKTYNLTRDGLVLALFSFTGKKAAAFKEAYIAEFNCMEKRLSQQPLVVEATAKFVPRMRLLLIVEEGQVVDSKPLRPYEMVIDIRKLAALTDLSDELKTYYDIPFQMAGLRQGGL